jgi:hypothetical protein
LSLLDTLRGIHAEPRPSRGDAPLDTWQRYCQEFAAAAEELRGIARRAEQAAFAADLHNRPDFREARRYGVGSVLPPPASKVRTNATMMLGCFAALEELRQKLASFANT